MLKIFNILSTNSTSNSLIINENLHFCNFLIFNILSEFLFNILLIIDLLQRKNKAVCQPLQSGFHTEKELYFIKPVPLNTGSFISKLKGGDLTI